MLSLMMPWHILEATTRRAVRGLLFDVDDTLTYQGRLQAVAFQALWEAAKAGLRCVAVTGRPLGWAEVMAQQWPVAAVIAENGAAWCRSSPGQCEHGYFASPEARREHAQLLARLAAKVQQALPTLSYSRDHRARRCELAWDVAEYQQVPAALRAQLVALIEAEGAHAVVSSIHVHAVPGSWNKASGACRAAAQLWELDLAAERHHWVFIGDSANDAPAFAFFPHSVGVANVRAHLETLSHPPRYITQGSHGHGFAEVVRGVLAVK